MDLSDAQRCGIRQLIEEWNPLAGAPHHQPVPGEYDRLINRILDALERDMPAGDMAHNIHEEVEQMGIALERDAADSIVRKIHELLLERRES